MPPAGPDIADLSAASPADAWTGYARLKIRSSTRRLIMKYGFKNIKLILKLPVLKLSAERMNNMRIPRPPLFIVVMVEKSIAAVGKPGYVQLKNTHVRFSQVLRFQKIVLLYPLRA
jgi:hypothetical protein